MMPTAARLHFSFARRFGVLLDTSTTPAALLIRADTPLTALAEAQRLACGEVAIQVISDTHFGELLASSYSTGQSAAEQVAQGLDDELDLMSLAEQVPQTADLLEQEGDAPIIRLINALLREAMREKASDVHLETFEHTLSVRMRIDGQLREVLRPKRELANLLVSRIKVMARLDNRQVANRAASELNRMPIATGGANFANHSQHDVFGGDTKRQLAFYRDKHVFHFFGDQALSGQHVLDFGRPNTVGQGTERTMGRSM